ncbi:hypothetical protein KA977_00835, partial [Candidatus Dependentiae bacterium]|nr:hypothetical protein [Candidatus Dependentiae bacterium]
MILKRKLFCLIIFKIILSLIYTGISFADVADTWSNVSKNLKGDFFSPGGAWSDTDIIYTDTQGYKYIELNLTPGTRFEYKFKVFGVDEEINNRSLAVPNSDTVIIHNWSDTPAAPVNLRAYSDNNQVILTWDTPASSSSWLDVVNGGGFNVYICTGPLFTSWTKINQTGITGSMRYNIYGLNNDSTYFFAVTAYDAYGLNSLESLKSDSITAIPKPQVNVVFRVKIGNINVSSVFLGYDTGIWQTKNMIKETVSDYWSCTIQINAGLTVQYKYYYSYSGQDTYEYSNNFNYVFVYPDTFNLRTVKVEGMAVGNSWGELVTLTKNNDGYWRGCANLTNKQYEYKFVLNSNQWVNDPNNLTAQNGNSLLFLDRFLNTDSRRTAIIPASSEYIISQDWEDTPISAPSNFIATVTDKSQLRLNWDKPYYIEDMDSVLIEYTETPELNESWIQLAVLDANIDSFIHKNLIPSDTYYYRIYSIDYAGNISQYANFIAAMPKLPVQFRFNLDLNIVSSDTVYWLSNVTGWSNFSYPMTKISNGKYQYICTLQPNNEVEYKYNIGTSNWEQSYRYVFEYYNNSPNLYKVQLTGDMCGWGEETDKPLLKKIAGTDTWIIEYSSSANQNYKFLLNGVYESGDNRIIPSYISNSNRKILLPNDSDTFYDVWSGLPDPPENVSSSCITETIVLLSWTLPQDTYIHNQIKIYRSADTINIDSGYSLITSLPLSSKNFMDSNLITGKIYYYRLACENTSLVQVREGNWSNRVAGMAVSPQAVTFKIDMSGIPNLDTVYISSANLSSDTDWKMYELTREGTSRTYSRTFSLQPGTAVSYKYSYYTVSDTTLTNEFPYSGDRKHLFIYPY